MGSPVTPIGSPGGPSKAPGGVAGENPNYIIGPNGVKVPRPGSGGFVDLMPKIYGNPANDPNLMNKIRNISVPKFGGFNPGGFYR